MVHAGYLEQFPTAGLTGKYTCVEDFYLRAREDAYLAGGIENGMIVAGHTPTLSKDYMMYNGGLVYPVSYTHLDAYRTWRLCVEICICLLDG